MSSKATKTPRARAKPAGAPARKSAPARKTTAPKAQSRPAKRPTAAKTVEAPKPEAATPVTGQRTGRTGIKLALTLALMAVIGGAAGMGTWSAFSSTTQNAGNQFAAGTVLIGDNDGGGTSPMLSFANASPGTTDQSCITVTYTGSLPSSVRLYGTTSTTTTTGLDQYLNLVVRRGSGAAGFDDCTGFSADASNYIGAGNGVIYSGTLQDFPDTYDTGLVDPVAGWTNPESHQYEFVVTMVDNTAAQGLNASQSFTWEARNN